MAKTPKTAPAPAPQKPPKESSVAGVCPHCQQVILDPESPKRKLVEVARNRDNVGAGEFRRLVDEMDAEELATAVKLLDAEMQFPSHPTAAQKAGVIKAMVVHRLHKLETPPE